MNKAFDILCNKNISYAKFIKAKIVYQQADDEKALQAQAISAFSKHAIKDQKNLAKIKQKAHDFVEKYHFLWNKIFNSLNCKHSIVALRSYIINEDRLYLHGVFSLSYWMACGHQYYTNEHTCLLMETIIAANCRNPDVLTNGKYISDIVLYEEGYTYVQLNGDNTYNFCMVLFANILKLKDLALADLSLFYKNKKLPTNITSDENIINIVADRKFQIEGLINMHKGFFFDASSFTLKYKQNKLALHQLHVNFRNIVA